MLTKWFPWRYFIRKVALAQGLIDPIALISKLRSFAQPSEVAAPVELLRLAAVLQARGLLNAQAIQHNLDWIWPHWVTRQFNPRDESFIPRAFSLTHINLTHRNWTAIGVPDVAEFPIVDPRGLLTPYYDSWSLDCWILNEGHAQEDLVPSHLENAVQTMTVAGNLQVRTETCNDTAELLTVAECYTRDGKAYSSLRVRAKAKEDGARLVIALRPFNPEGVSEVGRIDSIKEVPGWKVNQKYPVCFNQVPDKSVFSNYRNGDIYQVLKGEEAAVVSENVECDVSMATAAAVFRLPGQNQAREVSVEMPLEEPFEQSASESFYVPESASLQWNENLKDSCRVNIPDDRFQFLYDAAMRSIVLHSPGKDVFPGPYTYKHFWFRDASIILHAMLCMNLHKRAERILDSFPARQTITGYFKSQDGEWDSNGQALWAFKRYCELTGMPPKMEWKDAIQKGAKWIERKRLRDDLSEVHAGLFPAGFSAEHLGPNDYYYWDDFWGFEGFRSAEYLLKNYGENDPARYYGQQAARFLKAIEKSLVHCQDRLKTQAMPASPYRRMDTGAIGSLAAGYPLQIWESDDSRILDTAYYLLDHHFVENGFFHDMSHSGINPYLTLYVAQILLRHGDVRFFDLMQRMADLASATGQWPEAIHPRVHGGCMGDGHHVWASAEWVLMMRSCFVREEPGKLILGSGIPEQWLHTGKDISMGPVCTPYGNIYVSFVEDDKKVSVKWRGEWFHKPPVIEIRLPGYKPFKADQNGSSDGISLELMK